MRLYRFLLPCLLFLAAALPAGEYYTLSVLTFNNLTGNPDNDWVAEGFAEALTQKLSAIDNLRLGDRRQIAAAARVHKIDQRLLDQRNTSELKKITGSDYVIFGAIQSAGAVNNPAAPLRATARLVEVRTGRISRAILIDGRIADFFALQTRLARGFADLMGLRRSVAEERGMEYAGTTSLEAYRLYLQGLAALDRQEYQPAIDNFAAACAAHPGILYADAHYALGTAYLQSGRQKELLAVYKKDAAQLSAVFFNLGAACEKAGDLEKALKAYQTFVRYALSRPAPQAQPAAEPGAAVTTQEIPGPADQDGYLAIARLAERMQHPQEAIAACVFILNTLDRHNAPALRQLVRLYRQAGQNDLADTLEKRLQLLEAGTPEAAANPAPLPENNWLAGGQIVK